MTSRSAAAALLAVLLLATPAPTPAAMLPVIAAPIRSSGLATGRSFEAWVQLANTNDSRVLGLSMRRGDRIRIRFPRAFMPLAGDPTAYLLYGWPQGDIPMNFRVSRNAGDPRTIDIAIQSGIDAVSSAMPGLKSIHLIAPLRNPVPGIYHLAVETTIAGIRKLGETSVRIEAESFGKIAPFNGLHGGKNENDLRVARNARLPMALDFLVTDRSDDHPGGISVVTYGDRPSEAVVMHNGKRIGTIAGSPGIVLESIAAAVDGVVRLRVIAPNKVGAAYLRAALDGGTTSVLRIHVH